MEQPSSSVAAETRPLKIIELCLSAGRGGLELYAARLAPALADRGHTVLTVARPGSEFERLSGRRASLRVCPRRAVPLRGARALAALAADADVIHIHRSADLPLAAAAKRLARGRPALVYTRHMAITRDRRRSPVHRLLHRQVDFLVAPTERLATEAKSRLPLDGARIRILPPGVASPPSPAERGAIRPTDRDFVVGCFSRVERAKGQHELLDALAMLVERGINAAALICGPVMDACYSAELKRRLRPLGIAERTRFLSPIEDVRPIMACCDAVVMPSAGETFGLVLIEAMQMGVPVIGSAAGGVLEVISDGSNGLAYPPGDTQALAAALERLARDPEYGRSLGQSGRRTALERYDLATHVARLENLFRAAVH